MNTILLVCIGNICRSPVAEALLRRHFPEKSVHSAGIAALVGRPAHATAQEIAQRDGVDLSAHRARQITDAMCTEADLILVMESGQQRELASRYPLARGKIRCLGETPGDDPFEVADPYQRPREAFEQAHAAIQRGVENWARRLRQIG
ncbi:low molecular weight protein-tyrosine-phosphatase [Pusillimonas noertemannii]|uniref:protein-tyrosine-phosphatase n=1 Tax=Pusillimonas noertemannii TaxID=305977 RepID=A0A2U1CL84_9BURK|nr:low molecular weight protein-tyrosine-phosphatase [Pusillimonas noertemannii]NYT69277.1 low molecular weight phosphotyrosine protein phosphatase [Pusillimonas noertemannii]PVY61744.1 protein tyrosine phosphatase [Pusillimonas noertemannii]TFL09681.1 low molecular weight phosphotyrosine protein phosphatase [Pusillimonas noertemannii]